MGQRVKELSRRYFMEGVKSSNKLIASDLEGRVVPETDKAHRRETNQDDSANYLYQIRAAFEQTGKVGFRKFAKFLLTLEAEIRAGNCAEMCLVSAFLANEYEHVPRNQIYYASLGPPSDHSFCVISDAEIPVAQRQHGSVFGFCKLYPGLLMVDPWLNTACLASDYVRESKSRLEKWQVDGKRVKWGGVNSTAPGWYPPAGDYMHAMQGAAISLLPYA